MNALRADQRPAAPSAKPPARSVKRESSKKSFIIQRPSVHVHGYYRARRKAGVKYETWTVTHFFKGQRIRKEFADYDLAYDHAETIANRLENGNTALFNLTNERLADLLHKEKRLEEIELEQKRRSNLPVAYIPDLVAQLVQSKQHDQHLGDRHVEDLGTRCRRFAKHFQCPIASLDRAEVIKWLAQYKNPRTRNNYVAAINSLIAFAKTIGALPETFTLKLGCAKAPGKFIEIWKPSEITSLLRSAGVLRDVRKVKDLVPYLAIGAFAGPRSSELLRLDWVRNVQFDDATVFLPKEITKIPRTRVVPIQPNLATWLNSYHSHHGPICPYRSSDSLHRALRKIAKHAGLKWRKNALRDSYISYRVAAGVDIKTVADESGNSVQMIHQNYLKRVPKSQAEAWFNIQRIDAAQLDFADKIIAMPKASNG